MNDDQTSESEGREGNAPTTYCPHRSGSGLRDYQMVKSRTDELVFFKYAERAQRTLETREVLAPLSMLFAPSNCKKLL